MILQLFKSLRRTVLIDINTQRDLFVAGSHRCVRNHRRILRHIRRIVAWARHFHIPLQSGCDATLKRMKRNYSLKEYLNVIKKLKAIPGFSLSTDIIVGFPGETDIEFAESLKSLKSLKSLN